jgi:hypothetical protein
MSSKKVYFILLLSIILLLSATLAGVYFGNNRLKKSSESLLELKLEKTVVNKQIDELAKAKKDIERYTELESIANDIVPKDKDQAKAVREISLIATRNGISINNISFPSSNLGVEKKKDTKPSDSSSGANSNPKKETTAPLSQVESAEGLKGVYKLELTIDSDEEIPVSYDNLKQFLSDLENNRRTAQVSSIIITPDDRNIGKLSFSLTINVYIKP